jgi:hypothetical protein
VAAASKKAPTFITGHPTGKRIVFRAVRVHTGNSDPMLPMRIHTTEMDHVLTDQWGFRPIFLVALKTTRLYLLYGESSYTQINGQRY